jgi:hypothetical protein
MMFWGLRFGAGLAGLLLFFFDWRLGLVILFSVAEEFLTFLWMALPLFSVRYELAVVFGVALAVGLLVSGTEKNGIWWLPSFTSAGLLLLLRGTVYLNGVAPGALGPDQLRSTAPASIAVVLGTWAALILPSGVIQVRRNRLRARVARPSARWPAR